jgi:hypothetical protein
VVFYSGVATAKVIEVPVSDLIAGKLEPLLFEFSILDAFWAGDDGIDCGEPEVQIVNVDLTELTVSFQVDPAGRAHSCEISSYLCELRFKFDRSQGLAIFADSPVYPLAGSCRQ